MMDAPAEYSQPRMLFTAVEIQAAVRRLAAELETSLRSLARSDPLLVVGVLDGALVFMADLVRKLAVPMQWSFVKASSYGKSIESSGVVNLEWISRRNFKNADVLVLDDILDTGRTMKTVTDGILADGPRNLWTAVLLVKEGRQQTDIEVNFKCFTIPSVFAVGYGLDYAGRFRNLPYIGFMENI